MAEQKIIKIALFFVILFNINNLFSKIFLKKITNYILTKKYTNFHNIEN